MIDLTEVEAAATELSASDREQLLCFLAESLRKERASQGVTPRQFSKAEIDSWIAEDEA